MQNDTYAVRARWAHAVESYRRSVDLYRQVLAMRSNENRRALGAAAAAANGGAMVDEIPAAAPPRLETLTAREREVARLIARGHTNAQIAEKLVVTRGTVANHVAHILSKLDLQNRTQLAAYYVVQTQSAPSPPPAG
jgi:DNA-binding NarL/FixJ family response regulator